MRQSRYSDSQIMTILKLNERGVSVPDLCREHGMSTAMFYKRPLNPLLIDSVKNGGITTAPAISANGELRILSRACIRYLLN